MITRLRVGEDLVAGRLGNKLFQIAACIGVAEANNDSIVLQPWKFQEHFPNIPVSEKIDPEIFTTYKEPYFNYAPIPYTTNMTLDGYFQSQRYFEHCIPAVRRYFTPSKMVGAYVREVMAEIHNIYAGRRITVIQVRRDDYLTSNGYHTVQPVEYYQQAMDILDKDTDLYLLFCDKTAIDWCKDHFSSKQLLVAPQDHSVGDLFVMAQATNYIISTSTFGWWGAWLNPNEHKTVIAPRAWFGEIAKLNDADIIPSQWMRI